MPALPRLRRLCLALPEAEERRTWDCATFRVRDRIFAMHVVERVEAVWCKAPAGVQAMLVEVAPERFFVPPYVGRNGWIGIRLDRSTDWRELADLIERSWRMTAPRRLAAAGEAGASPLPVRVQRVRVQRVRVQRGGSSRRPPDTVPDRSK